MSHGFTTDVGLNSVTDAKLRDSAALSVIGRSANSSGDPADITGATVGHVLQVLSGPTIGFGAAPVGTAYYNPDAPPTGAWADEEFVGGAEALTWRWGNQGSSTITFAADSALLYTPTSSSSIRTRWTTPPSGSFFAVMKAGLSPTANNNLGGIIVLESGSEATPTAMSMLVTDATAGGTFGTLYTLFKSSYAGTYTAIAGYGHDPAIANFAQPFWYAVSYNSSTKSLKFWHSGDGISFRNDNALTRTLSAAPVSIGYAIDANGGSTGVVLTVSYVRIWNSEIQNVLEAGASRTAYVLIGN